MRRNAFRCRRPQQVFAPGIAWHPSHHPCRPPHFLPASLLSASLSLTSPDDESCIAPVPYGCCYSLVTRRFTLSPVSFLLLPLDPSNRVSSGSHLPGRVQVGRRPVCSHRNTTREPGRLSVNECNKSPSTPSSPSNLPCALLPGDPK